MARSVLSASAPRADVAQAASGFRSTQLALVCTGRFSGSTSIGKPPGPWNTARRLARDNNSYREPTGRLTMGSSLHGTPFDRRSLTASATRWPANGSGSMGSLRARARPCRRAVGAGPAGRAEGCGRRACPASPPGPAEPRPRALVRRSVGRLGAAARAAALAVLALAALALAVPERAAGADGHDPRQQHGPRQHSGAELELLGLAKIHNGHEYGRLHAERRRGRVSGCRIRRVAVSVCTVDARGFPTSECDALTPPSVFSVGILEFTTPTGTTINLNASTSYAVLLVPSSTDIVSFDATTSDNERFRGGERVELGQFVRLQGRI